MADLVQKHYTNPSFDSLRVIRTEEAGFHRTTKFLLEISCDEAGMGERKLTALRDLIDRALKGD